MKQQMFLWVTVLICWPNYCDCNNLFCILVYSLFLFKAFITFMPCLFPQTFVLSIFDLYTVIINNSLHLARKYARILMKGCVEEGLKWLLMQSQILLVIHNWIQGNLEGESGNLSEVTWGFSPCTPAFVRGHYLFREANSFLRGKL